MAKINSQEKGVIMKRILLLEKTDPPIERQLEWKDWYKKRMEASLNIPGFRSVRQFNLDRGMPKISKVSGEAEYLTLYALDSTKVLKNEPYQNWLSKEVSSSEVNFEMALEKLPKFARGIYKQVYPEQGDYIPPSTKCLFVAGHEVPRGKEREYHAWYNLDRHPAMSRVPGFIAIRRFVLAGRAFPSMIGEGGTIPRFLVVYDLESERVMESEAFMREVNSPWSTWVRSWLTRTMFAMFQRIYPED